MGSGQWLVARRPPVTGHYSSRDRSSFLLYIPSAPRDTNHAHTHPSELRSHGGNIFKESKACPFCTSANPLEATRCPQCTADLKAAGV
jgi:hypothetical protein